jgi:hypothetical protein
LTLSYIIDIIFLYDLILTVAQQRRSCCKLIAVISPSYSRILFVLSLPNTGIHGLRKGCYASVMATYAWGGKKKVSGHMKYAIVDLHA